VVDGGAPDTNLDKGRPATCGLERDGVIATAL